MPVQVSYPGVYIDEQLSGAHAITPVSTSVTAFIGMARRGRLGTPTRVTNLGQFQTLYGNESSMGELVPQVGQFFLNGGSTAWIMRIADSNAHRAAVTVNIEAVQPGPRLTASRRSRSHSRMGPTCPGSSVICIQRSTQGLLASA